MAGRNWFAFRLLFRMGQTRRTVRCSRPQQLATFAFALGGTAFAQGNFTNAANNKVDVGGGKGLVVLMPDRRT